MAPAVCAAILEIQVLLDRRFRWRGVDVQRILACAREIRIVAVEKPLAGLHGCLLILHGGGHVDAVCDAMAVGDN